MLTISFLVPDEMHEDVMQKIYKYIEILTATLGSRFAKQPFRIRAKECALAFVTLLDGQDVQLVYEDSQRYEELQAISLGYLLERYQSVILGKTATPISRYSTDTPKL